MATPFGAEARAERAERKIGGVWGRLASLHGPYRPPGPVDDERSELGRYSVRLPVARKEGTGGQLAASFTNAAARIALAVTWNFQSRGARPDCNGNNRSTGLDASDVVSGNKGLLINN